jgi:quercetin dioxygenase-like cupin family protein
LLSLFRNSGCRPVGALFYRLGSILFGPCRPHQHEGVMDMEKNYFVIKPEQRPAALDVLGTKVTILASSTATGCYGMTFQKGDEGSGPPPHSHDWDEAFYVLSGEVIFQCAGTHHTCPAGTVVHVPRNTVHGFNYGHGGGAMMEVTSRDSTAAEMFTAFDATVDAETALPAVLEVLKNNGVTVAA